MNIKEERTWRLAQKQKLLARLSKKKDMRSFSQVMKAMDQHTRELDKINKIIKDGHNW